MIFNNDRLQLQLLDVLSFEESDVIMRVRPRPFYALSLRIEGDTEIDQKKQTYTLSSHDLALFPANVPYLRRSKHDKMIVFHFNITNGVFYELELYRDIDFERLWKLFTEAREVWSSGEPGYYYRASAMLCEVFAIMRASLQTSRTKLSPQIADAIAYIDANLTDSTLSVNLLAERAHMSDTYFRHLFVRDMGITPKKYISDRRFELAQSLLNAGYDTVAAVAVKVGYCDAKNFATAYKRHFGFAPSAQSYAP